MNPVFTIHTIKAIIGLGNPGSSYARNRHSIGFRVVDAIADKLHASWHGDDLIEHTSVSLQDSAGQLHSVLLIKPQTFMNNSGRVMPFLQKKGIKPDQLLVVHDELEKPFGKLGIKFGGSHKGHNGLKSIIGVSGSEFWRFVWGIGRPADKNEVSAYVLSNFLPEEESKVPELLDQAVKMILESH
jgi:peptidyl-tRNA hydrolase, PTH1 family